MTSELSARRRALEAPEILASVFKGLWAKDLNSSAQVCKLWTPVAIDAKWSTCEIWLSRMLSRLAPLTVIRSLIDDFYSFKNIDITTEQWDQFQKEYAGKVTDINIDVVLNPACLSDLNNLVKAHGGSLCPRLRKLHIGRNDRQEEGHWTSIVELLAQPTLKEVEVVQGCLKNASMNDVIYTLVAKAPHIDTVEIFTPAFCPDYGAFSEAKRLSVDGFFDHATWRACAALPKLERLEIWDASYYEPLDAERRQTYAVTFVSLTKLGIHDEDEQRHPNFIASIFRNTTMPLLQTLELGCSRDVNMGMVRRCLAKRSPLLREIELNGKEEKGPIEIVDGGGGDGEDEEENEGSADVDDEYGSDHYQ